MGIARETPLAGLARERPNQVYIFILARISVLAAPIPVTSVVSLWTRLRPRPFSLERRLAFVKLKLTASGPNKTIRLFQTIRALSFIT